MSRELTAAPEEHAVTVPIEKVPSLIERARRLLFSNNISAEEAIQNRPLSTPQSRAPDMPKGHHARCTPGCSPCPEAAASRCRPIPLKGTS